MEPRVVFAVLATIGMILGYVVFLVAVWRLMRAHESIAETFRSWATGGTGRGGGEIPEHFSAQ
ncbi:MAG: hypothetical protein ACYTF6_01620 [Planctomycetota bacterium]|jgi:hypothetical protein